MCQVPRKAGTNTRPCERPHAAEPGAKAPGKRKSLSPQALCDSRADKVICAPVNSNADGRSTEVSVGVD